MRGATIVLAFVLTSAATCGASAACQKGLASAPFIGAADMRAIDRAVVHLPAERPAKVHLSVGAQVPHAVSRKPLPEAVAKVLPQYRLGGYNAFRVGKQLVIVNRRAVISYIMPIGRASAPGNCP